MESDDDLQFPDRNDLLIAARQDFPSFYLSASAWDEMLMDNLVLARAALLIGTNFPRDYVAPVDRDDLERKTDQGERHFLEMREAVRACPTFALLPKADQLPIMIGVFQVKPLAGE